MTFAEFMEAVVRVAQKLDIPHILNDNVEDWSEIDSWQREKFA